MKKMLCITLVLFCFMLNGCGFGFRSKAALPTQLHRIYFSCKKQNDRLAINLKELFQSMRVTLEKNNADAPFSIMLSNNYFTYSRPTIINATQLTTISFKKSAMISIINNKNHQTIISRSFTASQSLTLNANQIYTVNANDIMQEQLNREMISLIYYWLTSSNTKAALHDANNVKTVTHSTEK